MMPIEIIEHNYKGFEGSFLGQLHEAGSFDLQAFEVLCEAVRVLGGADKENRQLASMLIFILTQTLLHLMYHFDPQDLSSINDLPENYSDYVARLEQVVMMYFASK